MCYSKQAAIWSIKNDKQSRSLDSFAPDRVESSGFRRAPDNADGETASAEAMAIERIRTGD
jgi:hypothetical protein